MGSGKQLVPPTHYIPKATRGAGRLERRPTNIASMRMSTNPSLNMEMTLDMIDDRTMPVKGGTTCREKCSEDPCLAAYSGAAAKRSPLPRYPPSAGYCAACAVDFALHRRLPLSPERAAQVWPSSCGSSPKDFSTILVGGNEGNQIRETGIHLSVIRESFPWEICLSRVRKRANGLELPLGSVCRGLVQIQANAHHRHRNRTLGDFDLGSSAGTGPRNWGRLKTAAYIHCTLKVVNVIPAPG